MKPFNTPLPIVSCLLFSLLLAACLVSNVDEPLFLFLNNASLQLPDSFWGVLTTLSDPIVAPLLTFVLFYQKPLFLRAFFIAIAVAVACNYGLKYGFSVARPTDVLSTEVFRVIGPIVTSPSFPSGHTLTIFTLMGLVSAWYQKQTISIVLIAFAVAISFARISVGAHWPSDILFGALIGWLLGWLAVEIHSRLSVNIPEKLALTAYFIALFAGILSLLNKTPYPSGQWLSTAVALFAIAYALKSITELLHRQKG